MSYYYRGRTTHSYTEYQRWLLADEAEGLRQGNTALRSEANRLRRELGTVQEQHEKDIRETARRQARLEERQREYETVLGRVQHRQDEYERRAEQRRQTLERELRAEIRESREEVEQQVEELARLTSQQIESVRREVDIVRQEVQQGLDEVRQEVDETRRVLGERIQDVHEELQAERDRRIYKETEREKQAKSLVNWVEERLQRLEGLDPLGLTIERTRTQQHVERAQEQLGGDDREMALPTAQTAFASYQTAYLESERRHGVIDGVADHVEEIVARLEKSAADEQFGIVFPAEAALLAGAARALRERAAAWRGSRHWHTFENERFETIGLANRLAALATDLQGSAPGLIGRLRRREDKLREVADILREVAGPVDRFETGYGNPQDPKSPRLVRAYIGQARIDTYVDLEGTFSIDAYGFDSGGSCSDAAARMSRKLADRWQVVDARVDPTNPQTPSSRPAVTAESWQNASGELSQVVSSLVPQK